MSLRVDNLKVWYRTLRGDVRALDGVSFTVADGELVGLAGESGCGKSTLGKSLVRLDGRMRHVDGQVELDGKELPIGDRERMNGFRFKEVSIIPQYAMSAMNPTRKIGVLVAELLESRGERPAAVRHELLRRLELVGLEPEVLDRYPIELSGGMKQRMVMVISTLLNPSLLIADEVTSALDVSTQKAVAETLVELRDRHVVKSTILITHDLSLVYQIADSIIVMYAGRLAERAPTDALVSAPRHPYTRMLLAAPARGRGPLRRPAAGGHRWEPAVPAEPARGLPVPGPLPAGHGQVRRAAAVPRGGPRPLCRLLEGVLSMLRLDNVTKRYRVGTFGSRELVAVRDVSLEVRPGEVVALVGQSGSGKSTIGRMILRLTSASGGTISFDGADIAGFKGARLRAYYADVQGVFQDPFSSYNPVFKAERTLELVRETYFPRLGERAWRDRVEASLAAVRLDPGQVLGKYPHQLSGGQLQRLLVARALLLDIRLLVADEIISMLDASTRIDVLNLLGDLKARGLGILFITHDLSLGNYLSDTAVILHRGQVVETGPAERVFAQPAHPYTRSLLASVPQLHDKWKRTGHGVVEPAGEGA